MRFILPLALLSCAVAARAQRPSSEDLFTTFRSFVAAVEHEDEPSVRGFMKRGMRGDSVTEGWPSALHEAAGLGSVRMLRLLLPGSDVNVRDGAGDTPLHFAAAAGHQEAVKLLLAARATIDVQSFNNTESNLAVTSPGDTPLIAAMRNGRAEVLRLLVEAEADVRQPNAKGETPFFLALVRDDINAAKLLLEHGADVHKSPATGRSTLAQAAANGNAAFVDLLIRRQVNVAIADNNGITALMLAALHPSSAVVDLLLEAGADPVRVAGKATFSILQGAGHRRAACGRARDARASHLSPRDDLGGLPCRRPRSVPATGMGRHGRAPGLPERTAALMYHRPTGCVSYYYVAPD